MSQTDDSPKIENTRYHPPGTQAIISAARAAIRADDVLTGPHGAEHQTKSGVKRIRVKRCNRTVRFSDSVVFQCQLEQHDTSKSHEHNVTVFQADGTALRTVIMWRHAGLMSQITLGRSIVPKAPK